MPWKLWERLQEKKKKAEGLLPQVHFVPWIVLGCGFLSPVTNLYIQLIRNIYSCWMSDHGCKTQSAQHTLNLPCFCAFPDTIYRMCQATVLKSVCPERVLEEVLCRYLVRAYWHLFTCFSDQVFLNSNNLPWFVFLLHSCIKVEEN